MSRFLRDCLRDRPGYVAGEQPAAGEPVVKLNTNENPYPPSPAAIDAARAAVGRDLRRYPDPEAGSLRAAIAEVHGLDAERIVCGNGSDELLALILRACVGEGGKVASPVPTYSLYETLAALHGGVFRATAFDEDYRLPEALLGIDAAVVFLCNPNSPSGTFVEPAEVARLADSLDGLLVVDEAYAAFAGADCLALAAARDDVVVLRTLSKSHGLAGLRAGWAFGAPGVIAGLDKLRDRYNLDRIAQAAAAAAIRDTAHVEEAVAKVVAERGRLAGRLAALGFSVWPSRANFVLARWKEDAASLAASLKDAGILVRHFAGGRLADCLRVTVGLPEENDAFLTALGKLLG